MGADGKRGYPARRHRGMADMLSGRKSEADRADQEGRLQAHRKGAKL